MYIRELHVDGFGALHDVRLVFDKPMTVVYGPNEAGKSTLLRFIRSMLYGIAPRSHMVERAEPAYGGRHGGRMIVQAADGQVWQLERYTLGAPGRRTGGGLTIRDASGAPLSWTQAEWERRALSGISERLFRQLFAITLDDLHELLTLQGEEVGNFLYHAGLAGGASLSVARRKLRDEMNKLYRPQGRNQEINALLSERKALAALIRQRGDALEQYRHTMQQWEQSQLELAALAESLPKLAAEAAFLQDALQLREWWLKRQALIAEDEELRSGLPNPSCEALSEHAASEWAGLIANRAAAEKRHREAQNFVLEQQRQRQALQWDEDLLASEMELDKLDAMREAVVARTDERETVRSELQLHKETLDTLRLRLSADWSDADFNHFTRMLSEQEPLKRLQQAWAEVRKNAERLSAESRRVQRQLEALQEERKQERMTAQQGREDAARQAQAERQPAAGDNGGRPSAEHPFGPLRALRRDALLALWNELEDEIRRWERLQAERRHLPASLSRAAASGQARAKPTRLAVSVMLAALALGSLLTAVWKFGDGWQWPAMLLAAAVAAGTGAYVLASSVRRMRAPSKRSERSLPSRVEWDESRKRVKSLLAQLLEQPGEWADRLLGQDEPARLDELQMSGQPASGIQEQLWSALRLAVQMKLAEIAQDERERDREETHRRAMDVLQREAAALAAEMRECDQRREAIANEWTGWLDKYRLPHSRTPDSVPDLLHLAEQAQTLLRRIAGLQARMDALEEEQLQFREAAASMLRRFPPPPELGVDPAPAVAWLRRHAAEQRAIQTEARQRDRLLQEAEAALEKANVARKEAAAAVARMVAEAGEQDEAAFEHRLRIDERRRAIARELREIELRLEAGKTPEMIAALYRLLEHHDEAQLSVMHREAEHARQAAEDLKAQWLDKRGRLAQELERLRREAETLDHLQQAAELDNQLHRLTARYAVLALSDKLLEQTKTVFERERQPEVIKRASAYFERMTEGAYTRILVQHDDAAVIVESRDRRYIESGYLSRGTQEQLYLAMRFALADAASRQSPLPLLLDDLFVHYDERRLMATIPVLETIAQDRQIVLFTCHKHMVEAVRAQLPQSAIMFWEARRPAARRDASSGHG